MQTHEERWGIFIDFAAVVHDLMSDAQAEISEAILIDTITPGVVEQLSQIWARLTLAFLAFNKAGIAIQASKGITPEQILMTKSMMEKIDAGAGKTDEVLRSFFQQTGLASTFPSREASGEGLKPR